MGHYEMKVRAIQDELRGLQREILVDKHIDLPDVRYGLNGALEHLQRASDDLAKARCFASDVDNNRKEKDDDRKAD